MSGDIDFLIPGGGGGSGGAPSGPAGGDLGSTYPNPTVTGAHFGGSDGNFFVRRAGLWVPSTIAAGDLPGTVAQTGQANNFGAFVETAAAWVATLTGTNARFVGLTNGAPAAGTFLAGDFALDTVNNTVWICDTGGTPGTWVQVVANASQLFLGGNALVLGGDASLRSVGGAIALGALQTNIASQFMSGNTVRGYVRVTAGATGPGAGAVIAIIDLGSAPGNQPYLAISTIATAAAQFGDSVAVGTLATTATFSARLPSVTANTPQQTYEIRTNQALTATASYAFIYMMVR